MAINLNREKITKEILTKEFESFYSHLEEYYKKHNHILIPSGYACKDGYELFEYVKFFQSSRIKKKLTTEQKNKLNDLGFAWVETSPEWLAEELTKFLEYLDSQKANIHTLGKKFIEPNEVTKDGYRLGEMDKNFRTIWREKLTFAQIKYLTDAGYIFNTDKYLLDEFVFYLESIPVNKNSDTRIVKRKDKIGDYEIGRKAEYYRLLKTKGNLPAEYEEILNSCKFSWQIRPYRYEYDFDEFVSYLKEFPADELGMRDMVSTAIFNGYEIGKSAEYFRTTKTLTEKQKEILEQLNFVWKPSDYHFQRFITHFQEFPQDASGIRNISSHMIMEFTDSNGNPILYKIGNIVSHLRDLYRTNRDALGDKLELLTNLGLDWEPSKSKKKTEVGRE